MCASICVLDGIARVCVYFIHSSNDTEMSKDGFLLTINIEVTQLAHAQSVRFELKRNLDKFSLNFNAHAMS